VRAGHGEKCRTCEQPQSTALAETNDRRIDHSLHQPNERGTIRHIAGRIDNDIVPDHHPGQVCRLAHVANSHVQVWRNGSVNETEEFRLISHERSHFVSALKRQSEDALAGVASCAKEKDFHDRTSPCCGEKDF